MNEKISNGNEMINFTQDVETIRDIILKNMLKTRHESEPYYMPCKKQNGVRFKKPLAAMEVDFNEIYPEATEEDFAYFEFQIVPMHDLEVYINIKGSAEVDFNGERLVSISGGRSIPVVPYSFDSFNVPVSVKKDGENRVRIKCTKTGGTFGAGFILSMKRYPSMWANDYLYWMRAVIPEGELKGEEGVLLSALYKKGCAATEIAYKYPRLNNIFNFNELSCVGDMAVVYTVAKRASKLEYSGTVERIYVNGICIKDRDIKVNAGDEILIECKKCDNDWYFGFDDQDFHLPFLRGGRSIGTNAVCLTGFSDNDGWDRKYLDFKTVLKLKDNTSFWRFADGSYLRIYLDSVFFGQWFYALMVGFYGINLTGLAKGDTRLKELFWRNMKLMADHYDYIQYDAEVFGMPPFMPRCVQIDNLDNSGTMGMNFIAAQFIRQDEKIDHIIDCLAGIVQTKIPRFPDGTYYRSETMWADDTYMSIPFLVRLYKYTSDKKWLMEARRQIEGYKKRLYIQDKKIFSHIYFTHEGKSNTVSWGRANGWIMVALSEFLLYCDDEAMKKEILSLYSEFADGVISYQTESGMWRQVLDREEDASYTETSATAMFVLGLARGINHGWLDRCFKEPVEKAWNGLLRQSIDKDGNIYGVSMGSGCSHEAEYYFDIQTNINDDHGTGIILAAVCELADLEINL